MNGDAITIEEPVHEWFCLTYAKYLVLPRTALQSMPVKWQRRFVRLIRQLDSEMRALPDDLPAGYRVHPVDERGKFTRDPLRDYERGRRRVFKR